MIQWVIWHYNGDIFHVHDLVLSHLSSVMFFVLIRHYVPMVHYEFCDIHTQRISREHTHHRSTSPGGAAPCPCSSRHRYPDLGPSSGTPRPGPGHCWPKSRHHFRDGRPARSCDLSNYYNYVSMKYWSVVNELNVKHTKSIFNRQNPFSNKIGNHKNIHTTYKAALPSRLCYLFIFSCNFSYHPHTSRRLK